MLTQEKLRQRDKHEHAKLKENVKLFLGFSISANTCMK